MSKKVTVTVGDLANKEVLIKIAKDAKANGMQEQFEKALYSAATSFATTAKKRVTKDAAIGVIKILHQPVSGFVKTAVKIGSKMIDGVVIYNNLKELEKLGFNVNCK